MSRGGKKHEDPSLRTITLREQFSSYSNTVPSTTVAFYTYLLLFLFLLLLLMVLQCTVFRMIGQSGLYQFQLRGLHVGCKLLLTYYTTYLLHFTKYICGATVGKLLIFSHKQNPRSLFVVKIILPSPTVTQKNDVTTHHTHKK